MLDEKRLKEANNRVKTYLKDGIAMTKRKPEHVEFYIRNAEDSIDSAKALYELSTDSEKQKCLGFTSFNGLLWVVNASYYSMSYIGYGIAGK